MCPPPTPFPGLHHPAGRGSRLPGPRRPGRVAASPAAGCCGRGGQLAAAAGPPSRPRRGSSGDARARRCPPSQPGRGRRASSPVPPPPPPSPLLSPRYPEPSPARQLSFSVGASLGRAQPRCRAAFCSRDWRERVAPPAPAGDARGVGGKRRGGGGGWRGEEGASPAAARPSAGTARRRSGSLETRGRSGGRCRAAPGKGHLGAGSRRSFGEGPRRGAGPGAVGQRPLFPPGWLYKYVCRCSSWGKSVVGCCERGSGKGVWKARPSRAFLQDTGVWAAMPQSFV